MHDSLLFGSEYEMPLSVNSTVSGPFLTFPMDFYFQTWCTHFLEDCKYFAELYLSYLISFISFIIHLIYGHDGVQTLD